MLQKPKIDVLGRLIPDSGKIHQNQEVYNTVSGIEIIGTIKSCHYKDLPKILVLFKGDS